MKNFSLYAFVALIIIGCKPEVKVSTLRDVDIVKASNSTSEYFVKPKSDEEIRSAYAEYLKHSASNENTRMSAINRLAELEFQLSERLIKEKESAGSGVPGEQNDEIIASRLSKTIDLLETTLHDYPKAKNNDKILYQLAKAYDQKGNHEKSISALIALAENYNKSPYYIEAQFRIAEEYFTKGDYLGAELAYTEVISSIKSDVFYEKALFKRGWSRFKQELYTEAVDDFMEALTYHEFDSLDKLDKSEREQFDEYFRAIGLVFSNLGGGQSLYGYFKSNPESKYVYYTYYTVSDVFFKQERFTDAVNCLNQFVNYYPNSTNIPFAKLKIIDIWKRSGFDNQTFSAIEEFYNAYNPDSKYWIKNTDPVLEKSIQERLKEYALLVSSFYHNRYQKTKKITEFSNAEIWYQRYLKHFKSQARKDNVFYLYAELLNENKKWQDALNYYELSAYDNDIILNKEAAYATIILTDKLAANKEPAWIDKHIKYALLFSQQYADDSRAINIILHAAELAYALKRYSDVIEITSTLPESANDDLVYVSSRIRAKSYYGLGSYKQAEAIYTSLAVGLNDYGKLKEIQNELALAVYKQAESEKLKNNIQAANEHFSRISDIAPNSEIAPTALYDAVALSVSNKLWQESIYYINRFQKLYPHHKYSQDVTKKLSIAYLNTGQGIEAAQQFEKISKSEKDREVRMAALWQAAELYEEKKDYSSAIRSYTEYAETFKTPFPQYMESMYKLTELFAATNNKDMFIKWNESILKSDKTAPKSVRTDRTKYLASMSGLILAKASFEEYQRYKLIEPLKVNLKKKKAAMLNAVNLYGMASIYGITEITTQATYSIAQIYSDFSQSLLNSEKPRNLNNEELEQYQILLEDQAFPFEEKAIEFFETNISRVKDGIYNEWTEKSHEKLKKLFPVRYNREAKMEAYINVFN